MGTVTPDRVLRWQDAAVDDLEESHAHLSKFNPEAARRFAATILEAAEQLLLFPEPEVPPVSVRLSTKGPLGRLPRINPGVAHRI